MALLEVIDVSKIFPGVRALDQVSFTLQPGEVHALVGENGAGKSTLIKVLTGVYQPDGGDVRYLDQPVQFGTPMDAQRAGISTIYQEVNLVPLMSVAQNLFLGREPRRFGLIDRGRMEHQARAILTDYGVSADVRRPLGTLALGAQQMVALARAVMIDAKVVIMDEPTSSLEPREVQTLFGVIRDLHSRGIGIIYVSHRLDELYQICDAVTILRDGKLVHTGRLADLERIRLVSLMLGRDMAEVRREGATAFSGAATGDVEATPVLRVRELNSRHKLHDVTFDVRPGEVVGLGGLLGAGRSETIKAIGGAYHLDSGDIQVDGKDLRKPTPVRAVRFGVAVQPEDRKAEGIIPGLSVRENIALAVLPRLSRFGFVSDRKVDEVVDRYMKRLQIKASGPDQVVGDLSGGNQQKVLLARLLATGPKVLLLDEPTRGIDVGAKAEVQSLIDELAAEGLGVVLVSSDAEELVEGSDRVVVLRDGVVVGTLTGAQVTTEDLMSTIATEATREH
ncbi:sugar ABC transporter ATP-binding protein [Actinoplanes sp. M2I2]|uniref:sugar ABC transporter ATP-binding protein n=1 Tax=Actinoplanes sp. M2I2 TaxID=1734444 RepID=UPI002020EC02|nr:sugar ABC transporter ATP-binding protein [Actinoplanes sp. M2I2]